MAQTSMIGKRQNAVDSSSVRASERIKRSRAAASTKAAAASPVAATADASIKDRTSDCAATSVLAPAVVPNQSGCMLGLPCRPSSVYNSNSVSTPGPVLGIPTYPPGPGCFPSFPGPPQFMMFMMQRQMQHMQQAAMHQSWSFQGFGTGAVPGWKPGMFAQAFPGMPGTDISGIVPLQSATIPCFQPGSMPGCVSTPSPFPLSLSFPASANMKGSTYQPCCVPILNNETQVTYNEHRHSCSATMTAITTDDDKDSSHSDNSTQIEALTDKEFANFLDSFLINEDASPPAAEDAVIDLHLALSDLHPLVANDAHPDSATDPISLDVLLETLS